MTWPNLVACALTSLAIVLVPGPSALFIIGRSLALGRSGGVVSVLGDALGLLPRVGLVAIGVGALIANSPTSLLLVRLAGAAYLLFLGVQTIRHRHIDAIVQESPTGTGSLQTKASTILRQGFIVGITNPKSTIFFVAVLPQFVVPANGLVPVQMLLLGGIFLLATITVGSALALIAGTARDTFVRTPHRLATTTAVGGALMILLAGILAATAFLPS